jgi:GTP cyclohydrolase I
MSQTISLATRQTLRDVTTPHSDPSNGQGLEVLKTHYRHLIASAGEDISRDGLLKTPERAAKAWKFLTGGYKQDPVEILRSAVFDEEYSDSVLVKAIEFHSLCEHHLLPFFGRVHVAYVPDGRIVGLSKIPRMIDALARRLQVQERLTKQIAVALESALAPKGIAVWVEASHMCMMMRGVEKQHSSTATSVFRGVYENDQHLRDVFLGGIRETR